MIPIRDDVSSRSLPIMTWLVIIANVVIFIFEVTQDRLSLERLAMTYGMIPARLNLDNPVALVEDAAPVLTLVTSQFLHANWFHLISNMWILFIFGDNVEDRMGKIRFFIFYLLSGIAANLMQAFVFPNSNIPTVGASGAIAGVLGAYFVLFPHARVLTVIPLFIMPWLVYIPAVIYLGFWFILQLYSGLFTLTSIDMGMVAWWAHIGGFLFGVAMVLLIARPVRRLYG